MNFSYLRREPGFYRRVFTLALPVVLQNLITTSLGFMDTFMVGLVGQEQMSAVTVANVPIYIIQLIVFGLQSGSRVLISQFWGRGDRESINRVMGIGFFVAGGISTLCALTMGLFPRQVLDDHRQHRDTIASQRKIGNSLCGIGDVVNHAENKQRSGKRCHSGFLGVEPQQEVLTEIHKGDRTGGNAQSNLKAANGDFTSGFRTAGSK